MMTEILQKKSKVFMIYRRFELVKLMEKGVAILQTV